MWRQAWLGASRAVVSGEQGVDLEWRSRQVEKLLDCAAGQEHSATCAHTLLRNRRTTQHHAAGGKPTRPLPEHAHTHLMLPPLAAFCMCCSPDAAPPWPHPAAGQAG